MKRVLLQNCKEEITYLSTILYKFRTRILYIYIYIYVTYQYLIHYICYLSQQLFETNFALHGNVISMGGIMNTLLIYDIYMCAY